MVGWPNESLWNLLHAAGIVPYINASIILQLLATTFPSLKKLQREEGPQVRRRASST